MATGHYAQNSYGNFLENRDCNKGNKNVTNTGNGTLVTLGAT